MLQKGADMHKPITQNGINLFHRIQIFDGAQLKYIAMLSMLIDHVNKALIYPYLDGGILLAVSNVFDILGRIAFPLFIFFVVEGFFWTHSRAKYLGTMLGFAVVTEVPFDLFSSRMFFEPNWNNILFTFSLVLCTLWSIDILKEKITKVPWYILSFLIVAGMCLVAMLTGVDYEHHAILTGYFFYIFRARRAVAIPLSMISMYKEPWALLGFGLVLTYNGERGRQNKWFNYAFYPAHMLILGLLRLWLNV